MKAGSKGAKMYARSDRKTQIEQALAVHQSTKFKPMTMGQVAKQLGMSPSGHLMTLLWDLVDEGRIVASPRQYRTHITAWDFKLPAHRIDDVIGQVYERKSA